VLVLNRATLLVLLGLAVAAASCGGSPAVSCQSANCSSGTKAYQVCTNADRSISYNFGGQACNCQTAAGTQCQTCAMEVADYCGGGGPSGTGGGGGGAVTCTATFSGGFSGTYSPCSVTITYVAAGNVASVAAAGDAIPSTPYTWTGMSFVLNGMPTTETLDQTQSVGASNEVTQPGSQNPPTWVAAYGSGTATGSATLTLTSLGLSTAIGANGDLLYSSPHGGWTGTLVDQNPQTAMPNVTATITF
jgi:hypothetical protein